MKKTIIIFLAAMMTAACTTPSSSFTKSGETTSSGGTQTQINDKQSVIFQADNAVVQTASGKVRGYTDNGIYTYKGIQYAEAERFEMPHEVTPWEGVIDTVVYGGIAPQTPQTTSIAEVLNTHYYYPQETDETKIDTLNIWTPSLDKNEKKPVMVWLHGGGYDSGASNEQIVYDGRNMSERGDVVVVSINHRLNVLGFLDLSDYGEEYKYSGNLGMADIIASLQWIQKNISAFGGDPSNVTIFGQSGGAGKVMTLMAIPQADGLYHKAIMQSCWPEFVSQKGAKMISARTMELLKAKTVDDIKNIPYSDLYEAAMKAQNELWEQAGEDYAGFYPELDGDYIPENIWTPETIGERAKEIPLMIGTTFTEESLDGIAFLNGEDFNKNEASEEEAMKILNEVYGDHAAAIAEEFKKAFPEKNLVDAAYIDKAWYYPMANGSYRNGSMNVTNLKASQNGAPVFAYQFVYDFPLRGGIPAWHCSEIPFVFHNIDKVGITTGLTSEAYELQDEICDAWTTFAHTGNPNHEGMIEWPAYTEKNGSVMIFESESRIGNHFDDALRSEIDAWVADLQ